MNDEIKNVPDVPYIAHEATIARYERHVKRLWVTILILIGLLVATNAGWIIYEAQFEDIVVTQDVETGEGDALIAGVGDVNYGTGQTDGKGAQT